MFTIYLKIIFVKIQVVQWLHTVFTEYLPKAYLAAWLDIIQVEFSYILSTFGPDTRYLAR